ncbi:metallophosphoesterase, partial [bacterium]|nr:metallophosphoesterase [bacterium]
PFLLVSAGLGLISAAMVYDAAERLIGQGKGIYAAAVFFSFAPLGSVISDSALLPISSLLFITASVNWLAVRAEGRNRAFNLFVIGGLLLFSGFLFSFLPLCLVFLFGIWLAAARADKKLMVLLSLLAAFFIGSVLRTVLDPGIPLILELPAPENVHAIKAVLLQLPWLVWIVPLGALVWHKSKLPAWQSGGLAALILVYSAGLLMKMDMLAVGAAAAPMLALCVTDLLFRWFARKRKESVFIYALPGFLSALAMLLLVAARFVEVDWFEKLDRNQGFAALFLFVLAIVLIARKLPRWSFGVSVALGLLAGSLWWVRPGLLDMEDPLAPQAEPDSFLLNYIPVLIVAMFVVMRRLYGRRMPRAAQKPGERYQFSKANLRLFDRVRRPDWSGEPVDIAAMKKTDYSFVIFGDVTGGEFPVSSRRGGYFVYRELVEEIEKQEADFVISVGDLATQAGIFAYRRLRQILRHIPVPIAVSPGNHDLFADEEYLPHYFQSLFGADQTVFTLGSVKFVLLNNARGTLEDEQFDWLERVLPRDEEGFIFVFCHKPPIDPREHEFYGMENRAQAARLHELFKQHHVTAVFSGHIHALLTHEQDGVTYIISGGGGSKLDDRQAVHHYLLADVTEKRVRIRALPIRKKEETAEATPLLEITFQRPQ